MTQREEGVEIYKVVFEDRFRQGSAELPWLPYSAFNQDNLQGSVDSAAPVSGEGIGVLRNAHAGGFVALSYVAREVPPDFVLSAWIFATVSSDPRGQLNGLAFRIDPAAERFYRVATDFAAHPALSLAYVGRDSRNMPVYLRKWSGEELPGGITKESSWHRLSVAVISDQAEVSWDGVKLPGGPYRIDLGSAGCVGVYANYIGNLKPSETRVQQFRLDRV